MRILKTIGLLYKAIIVNCCIVDKHRGTCQGDCFKNDCQMTGDRKKEVDKFKTYLNWKQTKWSCFTGKNIKSIKPRK